MFIRVQRLEQYDDSLENLALVGGGDQDVLAFENLAFSIQYRLDREARQLFQSVDHFRSPFGYSIKCAHGDREGNEAWCKTKMVEHSADRFLTNAMPELAFEGCERFEAIEAIFATQFGGR